MYILIQIYIYIYVYIYTHAYKYIYIYNLCPTLPPSVDFYKVGFIFFFFVAN